MRHGELEPRDEALALRPESRDPARFVRGLTLWLVVVHVVGCAGAVSGDRSSGSAPRPADLAVAAQSTAGTVAPGVPSAPEPAPGARARARRPVPADLSREALSSLLSGDLSPYGAMSVGRPNRGALFNGVRMPEGPLWEVVDPRHSFGTEETIESLTFAIHAVHAEFPGTPRIYVGQISAEHGGYLRPHRSHQSGRDVDLGYYYREGPRWYVRANEKTLDAARTWALVKALVLDPNIETLFIDRSVQALLRKHAESREEDPAFLDTLFQSPKRRDTLIRHEWGHLTHVHVRFRCPEAQEAGSRAHRGLLALSKIPPRKYY